MSEPPADDELTARRRSRDEAGLQTVEARAGGEQHLGYAARDFVMCGLPFKRPHGQNYRRRNGEMLLEIIGSEKYGLPYGQDRLIPIWLATAFFAAGKPTDGVIRFRCAKDILRAFGLCLDGGVHLKRLRERMLRVFYSTFFVTKAAAPSTSDGPTITSVSYRLMKLVRMNLCDESRRHANQYSLWRTRSSSTPRSRTS